MSEMRQAFEAIRAEEDLKAKTRLAAEQTTRQPVRRRRSGWQVAVAAFMAVVLMGGGVGYYTITAEAAYVSVETAGAEVEPGLGLSVNRWGNVIATEALNESGQAILAKVNPVGMKYEDAVEAILAAADELGYLEEEMQIDFSVCAGAENELVESLQQVSADTVEQICPYVQSGCRWATTADRQAANGYGMSCGRYRMAAAIMELDATVTMEDCSQYTLHQLTCWYQALCDGAQIQVDEVPTMCEQYGCGLRGWCYNQSVPGKPGSQDGAGNSDTPGNQDGQGNQNAPGNQDGQGNQNAPGYGQGNQYGPGYGHHGPGHGRRWN